MTLKLNIGSGLRRYDGFINIDDDVNVNPDFIVNLEQDKLPFEDNSVGAIIAYHILEHIGPGYFHLMQEIYRVCQHGAIIDIQVPHPRHEYFLNDPTHIRPIMVEGLKMLSKKYNKHLSETQGSVSGLAYKYNVDFELVAFQLIPDPYYNEIIKTSTSDYLERLSRESNNFFMEIHATIMAVKHD